MSAWMKIADPRPGTAGLALYLDHREMHVGARRAPQRIAAGRERRARAARHVAERVVGRRGRVLVPPVAADEPPVAVADAGARRRCRRPSARFRRCRSGSSRRPRGGAPRARCGRRARATARRPARQQPPSRRHRRTTAVVLRADAASTVTRCPAVPVAGTQRSAAARRACTAFAAHRARYARATASRSRRRSSSTDSQIEDSNRITQRQRLEEDCDRVDAGQRHGEADDEEVAEPAVPAQRVGLHDPEPRERDHEQRQLPDQRHRQLDVRAEGEERLRLQVVRERVAVEAEQEVERRRQHDEVAEHEPGRGEHPREQHEPLDQPRVHDVDCRHEELPHLPEDHRQGQHDPEVDRDPQRGQERLGRGEGEQRVALAAASTSSGTFCMNQPMMCVCST